MPQRVFPVEKLQLIVNFAFSKIVQNYSLFILKYSLKNKGVFYVF